jgi:phosphoglycolate phosphatase-like HAD superfamily hydrolase
MSGRNGSTRVILFWDLDGTLLTTARAGIFAFEEAVREVCGAEAELQKLFTSGLTDAEVAALCLETAGLDAERETVEAVLRAYERRLPRCLPRRAGRVMPGVREVLEDLELREEVRNLLLTGNTPDGARAKLAHYGLDRFFPAGAGAFCLGPGARVEIAHRALALAADATDVFVIGDTPQDVACGKAIGARTIAVASGSHSADDLAAHEPWAVLDRVPETTEFRTLVGIT